MIVLGFDVGSERACNTKVSDEPRRELCITRLGNIGVVDANMREQSVKGEIKLLGFFIRTLLS